MKASTMLRPRLLLIRYLFGEHRGRGLADQTALSVIETSVTLVPSSDNAIQRDLVAADQVHVIHLGAERLPQPRCCGLAVIGDHV